MARNPTSHWSGRAISGLLMQGLNVIKVRARRSIPALGCFLIGEGGYQNKYRQSAILPKVFTMRREYHEQLRKEFDRQVNNLLQKGYPEAAGVLAEEFLKHIEPLKERIEELAPTEIDVENGQLPFVIVIKRDFVPAEKAMSLVEREGKKGTTKMYPREPNDFKIIDGVSIPNGLAYLLVDIDRGKGSINITPSEALKMIKNENRSPLTIDEGVAIVTQCPGFLIKNNCFSLLASRYSGDKRVPAIWINNERRSNLGWCWDGNPHTWLGSASCGNRI